MRQDLTTDTVERYIDASPELLYDIVSDVTRAPELSPEIVKCTWVKGATGPAVGARFRAMTPLAADGPGRPITLSGWFVIDTLSRLKDRATDLRRGMTATLDRLAALAEREHIS